MQVQRPFFEYGFWWWYDPERKDWFVDCAPSIGYPKWWKPEWSLTKGGEIGEVSEKNG
jgi:hypothetical protein